MDDDSRLDCSDMNQAVDDTIGALQRERAALRATVEAHDGIKTKLEIRIQELVSENERLRHDLDGLRQYQEAAMDEYMKALCFGQDYDRKCSTVTLGISNLLAKVTALEQDNQLRKKECEKVHRQLAASEARVKQAARVEIACPPGGMSPLVESDLVAALRAQLAASEARVKELEAELYAWKNDFPCP